MTERRGWATAGPGAQMLAGEARGSPLILPVVTRVIATILFARLAAVALTEALAIREM